MILLSHPPKVILLQYSYSYYSLGTCPVLYTYIHHNGRLRGQYYSYYMVTDTKPTRPPVHPPLPLPLVLGLSPPPSFHDHSFGTHPLIAGVLHATILHCRQCHPTLACPPTGLAAGPSLQHTDRPLNNSGGLRHNDGLAWWCWVSFLIPLKTWDVPTVYNNNTFLIRGVAHQ